MAQIEANDVVEQAIDCHAQRPGGLLPLLHAIQDRLGYLPQEFLPRIAVAMRQWWPRSTASFAFIIISD